MDTLFQVSADKEVSGDAKTGGTVAAASRNKAAGVLLLSEHVRRFLQVMGMFAASTAVTVLAVGATTPAIGVSLLVLLLGGLSLMTLCVTSATDDHGCDGNHDVAFLA